MGRHEDLMDFIGRLARFGVPLLGGPSSAVPATCMIRYHMRGSCATQATTLSITAITRESCRGIHCVTIRPNSPWSRTTTATLFQGSNGYVQQKRTKILSRSFSQSTAVNISSPAHSVVPQASPPRTRVPHHRTQYLSQRRGAPPSILPSSPRLFSTTCRASCSAIIPSSIMTDRDTLPSIVRPSHYDLSISSLNFDDWSYKGQVA